MHEGGGVFHELLRGAFRDAEGDRELRVQDPTGAFLHRPRRHSAALPGFPLCRVRRLHQHRTLRGERRHPRLNLHHRIHRRPERIHRHRIRRPGETCSTGLGCGVRLRVG